MADLATIPALRRARLAAAPAAPLITWYDLSTGERVELSHATFDGWVAKTAGLMRDVVGLDHGAEVAIDLPRHWLAAVWLAACAELGVAACLGGDPASAHLAVCAPEEVEAALSAPEVMVVSLLPMAMPLRTPLPAGAQDYCLEVRSCPDRFAPSWRVPPTAPAWRLAGASTSQAEAVAGAEACARDLGLAEGSRDLLAGPADPVEEAQRSLVVPLVTSGSVVLVAGGADGATLAHLAAQEGARPPG